MIHLLIGFVSALITFLAIYYIYRKGIRLSILKIVILGAEVVFIVFVLELIYGFIIEGSFKAALLMGIIFGFPCIVAALLIFRWLFTHQPITQSDEKN